MNHPGPNIAPTHALLAMLGAVAWLKRAERLLLQGPADEAHRSPGDQSNVELLHAALGLIALRRKLDSRLGCLAGARPPRLPADTQPSDLGRLLR